MEYMNATKELDNENIEPVINEHTGLAGMEARVLKILALGSDNINNFGYPETLKTLGFDKENREE
jgi:hypothetical protein